MNEEILVRKVREIAQFSNVFKVIYEQNRKPYPNAENDWIQALQFYLHGYAFERQGRSPEYSTAAIQAVQKAVGIGLNVPDTEFPQRAWNIFLRNLRLTESGKGANPSNNPLFPKEDNAKESVTSLILKLHPFNFNILKAIEAYLVNGSVKTAHCFLCQIRGTGAKINSLFLRDFVFENHISIDEYDPLLQPIDVWVRRLMRLLMGYDADTPKNQKDKYSDDGQIADVLIHLSKTAGVSPLALNQGAWYFGAQIAGMKSRLIRYVEDELSPIDAVNEKVRQIEEEVQALKEIIQ